MAITKDKKVEIINELKDLFKDSKSVVFTNYRCLNVKKMEELRSKLRENESVMKVAKKTLMQLAAKENGYDNLPESISDIPVAAVFSMKDEVTAASTLKAFSKENEELALVAAMLDGELLETKQTMELASIPPFEVLIGKLLGSMKAPISGFHGTLHNVMSGFVRVLDAKAQKDA